MQISQETTNKLYNNGAFFILINFPIRSSVGIDMKEFTTGEKFLGFKMIPPGIHFIHYNSVSRYDNSHSPKSSFFHKFSSKEVVVKKWDPQLEDIVSPTEDEINRYSNLKSMDSHLGAYPFEQYQIWKGLTDYIDQSLLSSLNPSCGLIRSATQFLPLHYPQDINPQSSLTHSVEELLPNMKVNPDVVINFSPIPKIRYPQGSTPSEMTKHSLDSTFILETILTTNESLLGQLQYAFVTFLVGQVYDSFEYWKRLLYLLCSSDVALTKYPQLFISFIRVLYFQLKQIPQDMFVDIVENNNFLVDTLRNLFLNAKFNEELDPKLLDRLKKFKAHVTKQFEWDFDSEPDDERPVIVNIETTEQLNKSEDYSSGFYNESEIPIDEDISI